MIETTPLGEKWKRFLKKALGTSTRWAKDECGDYNLLGTEGKIFVGNTFWYVYVEKGVDLKKRLDFMILSQDGGTEAIFKLDRLPTKEEAKIIRNIIGLKKKRTISPEHLQKLIESNKLHRFKPASK